MRSVLFLLLTVFSSASFAATYLIRTDDSVCPYFSSAALTCAAVAGSYNSCSALAGSTVTVTGCASGTTVAAGTKLTKTGGAGFVNVTAIPAQPTCAAGTHLVLETNTCVSDVLTCVPSMRTIDPCPSGYAPSVSAYSTTQLPGYPSIFDAMAMQDVLVACAYAVFLMLGFHCGRTTGV